MNFSLEQLYLLQSFYLLFFFHELLFVISILCFFIVFSLLHFKINFIRIRTDSHTVRIRGMHFE